mmetsp:Transcript_20644/g.61782  ORF Transcript_20644/g.61782 Transcript_20644/m.61782 type:complete len:89 (+) Transcript_20644:2-268(+)
MPTVAKACPPSDKDECLAAAAGCAWSYLSGCRDWSYYYFCNVQSDEDSCEREVIYFGSSNPAGRVLQCKWCDPVWHCARGPKCMRAYR